ncbi:ABC transporter ATP-binding protein [Clostridium estertheticum]|uniref:ABC transporter ATP-binding protein n=1 Tax=Clostridium estertheticum TaxID=238834 RepID=UPI001CF47FFC|nr:ABC transporter ATP-binding protein [Clostridium estertheticum]MCB2308109.1 ABC transporter ATP-binding protein [Clostridium estertheticum]MCB2346311.1 ABC transporter ATP-binding protein [Clostridium estertheticum]MCB2349497.1 ABC transporter ATP-binding protein [Clostridium estertheticum]WAG46471.1 ABC transporter ATP-binding protein [Clostridium estertheticum]
MFIEISNLKKQYNNGPKALNDISLHIGEGVFGLLGENGAGKTTLMRILVTLMNQTSGLVNMDGTIINSKNASKIRCKIGYLPQELGLHPNLTVRETLDYFGILSLMSLSDRKQQIDKLLVETNLEEHANKKIRQLSGGMKRRVGLAQAMLNNPSLLVVDEPTTGLDPEERIRIRMLLSKVSKGRTIILSTHVVEDVASICNKLAIMEKGKIIFTGSVPELINIANNHVFTKNVQNEAELIQFSKQHTITNSVYTSKGICVRFISDFKVEDSVTENPNIEDAYIYVRNLIQKKASK